MESSVTTQKRINLDKLTTEVGAGLVARGLLDTTAAKTIESSEVTQAQLQAAVDAHVYVAPIPIPPVTEIATRLTTLETTTIPPLLSHSHAYPDLTDKPTLGTAASRDTGTGNTHVVLGNDARLSDPRTPTSHTHPAAQVTGLHAVATSGAYADLTGRPTIPAAMEARRATVNSGALTANTVKSVAVTWPIPMPSTAYSVTALSHSATPQNIAIGVTAKTTNGCTLAVRSTAAVAAAGLNIDVIGLA